VAQAARRKERNTSLVPRAKRLVREAALYALSALSLYLVISLWTYHSSDPSWTQTFTGRDTANLGGVIGALAADLLYSLFGYLAYLIPVLTAYAALRVYVNRKKEAVGFDIKNKIIITAGLFMTIGGSCGLAALHFSKLTSVLPFSSGGIVGQAIASSLSEPLHFIGTTILLLTLLLAGITLLTGLSWLTVMDQVGRTAFAIVDLLKSGYYYIVDGLVGMKARRRRREVVAADKEVLDRYEEPPRIEPVMQRVKKSGRAQREQQVPLFETPGNSELPPLSLLDPADDNRKPHFSKQSLEGMAKLVEKKLLDFNIEVHVVAVHPGPVITRFEIEPAAGIKASQITNLARDLARALSVTSLRVVENIPGKSVIGIEVPNENREVVRLSELLSSQSYEVSHSPLSLALGKDISGNPVVVDLAKMPHLLIAGTTGSGKSVCVNALVMSLVYKSTPDQVRMIMIDPKMLELAVYQGIPHLLSPVVTDMKEAANALKWCIFEMERRYRLMAALGVRNIAGYNRKVLEAEKTRKPLLDPLAPEGEEAQALTTLPFIVILIDELADLMMVVGKKVEQLIARLAQKARAAGLHLIVATQRPSVDVITGLIKANIPARIAFQMSSRVDSRTVLDQMGAEQLLGQGDMLFLQPGQGLPTRIHGAFVADHEVHKVARTLKQDVEPVYNEEILSGIPEGVDITTGMGDILRQDIENEDPLYDEALRIVTETRRASISGVQRRLRIGYNRAARLIEEMERVGIVGPLQSNGSREVLAPPPVPAN
jgi:S-DNA-T family DNA segregation ATPase FtsK/SpoIIIE